MVHLPVTTVKFSSKQGMILWYIRRKVCANFRFDVEL